VAYQYSDKLIAEITTYYREKCGVDLSHEEAVRYLDSFAELYRLMQRSMRRPSSDAGKLVIQSKHRLKRTGWLVGIV